jgi:hypothetical protein
MHRTGLQAIPPPSAGTAAIRRPAGRPHLPGGRLVGMETAPVAPARIGMVVPRLVATWPYSYLLCDEVGLGKTLKPGWLLFPVGPAWRTRSFLPPGQSHRSGAEMASKLLLSFRPGPGDTPDNMPRVYLPGKKSACGLHLRSGLVIHLYRLLLAVRGRRA